VNRITFFRTLPLQIKALCKVSKAASYFEGQKESGEQAIFATAWLLSYGLLRSIIVMMITVQATALNKLLRLDRIAVW
jgi:hypothetical protein